MVNQADRYSVALAWSDEDEVFVGEVRELPGCTFHGCTRHDALDEATLAIDAWIEAATAAGNPIPQPRQFELGTVVVPRLCDIEALPAYYRVLDNGSRCEEVTVRAINAYVKAASAGPVDGKG